MAYATMAAPIAALVAALLVRQGQFPVVPAIAVAAPLALAILLLALPVWYICRAFPVGETPILRLVGTHAAAALCTGLAWYYQGTGLVRVVAGYTDEVLVSRYAGQFPALLAGGAALYLLSAALYYMLMAEEAVRQAEKQAIELTVLAREAELRALKAQVHPHFLFNSLNSISSLTTHDPGKAREMCILLSEFFRKSLAMGARSSVPLEEELALARTYLGIEALRLGSRLSIEETIDAASGTCLVPPLLLQPLVENAIRHGVATCAEGGTLRLSVKRAGEMLQLSVTNPFDPEAPHRPGVGLGLTNVRQRLQARYGREASMDASGKEGLYRVTLTVPMEAMS
jgi:hypothetical protein